MVAAGVTAVALFWLLDAAIDHFYNDPDIPFIDCLLHPGATEIWARLLETLLFLLLGILAATLLYLKENAEARLRHSGFRLEELMAELAQKNEILQREIHHRQEIERQLAKLSVTDQLTGIFNRRKFDETLQAELRQEARYPRGLALITLDIDHFKDINDLYGHAEGDTVLKELAQQITATMREADSFFRVGGEEFSLITFAPDSDSLALAAEKLRRAVATHVFRGVGRLTISLGASLYHAGDDYDSLCQRADEALYQAKDGGRNQVMVA